MIFKRIISPFTGILVLWFRFRGIHPNYSGVCSGIHNFLHHGCNSGTKLCVAFCQSQNPCNVFPIRVGEFPARLWPHIINGACVRLLIKEGTWSDLQHPIAIVVALEVLLRKPRDRHFRRFGDSFDVTLFKDGTGRLAAMAAFEAIYLLKNRLMGGMKVSIERLWRTFFPALELLLNGLAVLGRPTQVMLQFRFQWGSWNLGFETNVVSVRVCRNASNRSF